MIKNKCLVCGSFDFRADRALSGRLICISCGYPYGVRRAGRNKFMNNASIINTKQFLFIFLLVFVIIIVII